MPFLIGVDTCPSVVVPAAMAAILVLLVVMFSDIRLAGLIFRNVPIAATGGILALRLRDLPFSVSAAVGFIATFGIAVLNGVVLTSTIRDPNASASIPARPPAKRRSGACARW